MRVFVLLISILFASDFVHADVQVKVRFSPLANLVYQLDCISGSLVHCSSETYLDLWKKNFLKSESDVVLIEKWGALMKRYNPEVELGNSKNSLVFEGVRLSTKIRLASFQSMTISEYFNRLDLVVTPKDREKFEEVILHFYPGFDKWWKTTALPKGKPFSKGMEVLLKRKDISEAIQQFAHFYSAELPDKYDIPFNLFYRPEFKEGTGAEQIENYAVAEFLPNEKPAERADVVIHELCHFFFRSASEERLVGLQNSLSAFGTIESRAAYNLLNETLATALGNGILGKMVTPKDRWQKYLQVEQSFYNNYYIDKAAKAILPWMEKWIGDNRTLYDAQFASIYLNSLKTTFEGELSSPRLMLGELVLVPDGQYGEDLGVAVRKYLRVSSMYISSGSWQDAKFLSDYQENPQLTSLFVVHPSNIRQMKNILSKADFSLLEEQYHSTGQVLFSFKRSPSVPGYVIVAKDYQSAVGLIDKIGSLKQGFDGPYQGP